MSGKIFPENGAIPGEKAPEVELSTWHESRKLHGRAPRYVSQMPVASVEKGRKMKQDGQYGFALPVAVFALVVIGVIITSGFYTVRQEGRIGVADENANMAFYLTEQGLVDVIGNWNAGLFSALPNWGDTAITRHYAGVGLVTARVTKMTDLLYFVDADGLVTKGGAMRSGASHRVGVTVRLSVADIAPPAALTTRGPTTLKGTAEVHGEDEVPTGWSGLCTGSLTDKPGIMTDNASQVGTQGGAILTGDPAVQEDTSIADSTFNQFGDLMWDDLTALADIRLSGGSLASLAPDTTVAGDCNTGQAFASNWGDPENPGAACANWFPIIHITGDANIQSGGVGQGIMLVDGDLDLRGNFLFHGIVIVQGSLATQGSGNRIFGGVMASNASFSAQAIVGGSVVTTSTCAVSRAIQNSGATRVRPLASRSWVDLSAIAGG